MIPEPKPFSITPGAWSTPLTYDFPVRRLILTVRNERGDRVESGLPDDLAVDIGGTSYPVRSRGELRGHMEDVFGYTSDPDALDNPGAQDSGVLVVTIPIPAGQTAHLHATWPDAVGHGTLDIMAI